MPTALVGSGALLLCLALIAGASDALWSPKPSSQAQELKLNMAEPPRNDLPEDSSATSPDQSMESPRERRPHGSMGGIETPAAQQDSVAAASGQEPRPVAAHIPAIGIEAPLVALGLTQEGQLEAPETSDVAGWYADGAEPGEPGAAVIAGHVDSTTGPGIFRNLGNLAPGDTIVIERVDGSQLHFVVNNIGRWHKDDFPTDAVYHQTGQPQLRLITCAGKWDDELHSYTDNVVVFADLTET